jgi:hypothetical protein
MFEIIPLALRIDSQAVGSAPIIIGIIILVIGLAILSYWQDKKRREALQAVALQLGFSFSPDEDHSFADQYGFLNQMNDGSNRYAFNILHGTTGDGSPCSIFDYHYETHSTDSKGRRTTHHHYLSVFALSLLKSFPELEIKPEGFFSKLGQALGFDDIDFESMEFSKRYQVKSDDKKFAYDFCNALMIDFLLGQPELIIEVEQNVLAITFTNKLEVELIVPNYERLLRIRSLMPEYLFA